MYAKIIDGIFTKAPNKLSIEIDGQGYTVFNPTAEMLIEQGWKPVEETEHGDAQTGFTYVPTYTETENAIVQQWELVSEDDLEISAEQALGIIMGESE